MTEYLGSIGELDNTYVMFCSDNDAEAVGIRSVRQGIGCLDGAFREILQHRAEQHLRWKKVSGLDMSIGNRVPWRGGGSSSFLERLLR